jgi:hypothetical protein
MLRRMKIPQPAFTKGGLGDFFSKEELPGRQGNARGNSRIMRVQAAESRSMAE